MRGGKVVVGTDLSKRKVSSKWPTTEEHFDAIVDFVIGNYHG
jgi:hypothetical protein